MGKDTVSLDLSQRCEEKHLLWFELIQHLLFRQIKVTAGWKTEFTVQRKISPFLSMFPIEDEKSMFWKSLKCMIWYNMAWYLILKVFNFVLIFILCISKPYILKSGFNLFERIILTILNKKLKAVLLNFNHRKFSGKQYISVLIKAFYERKLFNQKQTVLPNSRKMGRGMRLN